MIVNLIKLISEHDEVDEQLKAENRKEELMQMNNIKDRNLKLRFDLLLNSKLYRQLL